MMTNQTTFDEKMFRPTVELTRRREFIQASPEQSWCETRSRRSRPTICSARRSILFQHTIPFFQRRIPATLRQWARMRSFDFEDFVSLPVHAKLQTRATKTVVAGIRYDPLAPFEFWPWPIARHLIAALHAESPFRLAIIEPDICGRGIRKPTATRFEIGQRHAAGQVRSPACKDERDKNQSGGNSQLGFHK
jgi:hypothetical protein